MATPEATKETCALDEAHRGDLQAERDNIHCEAAPSNRAVGGPLAARRTNISPLVRMKPLSITREQLQQIEESADLANDEDEQGIAIARMHSLPIDSAASRQQVSPPPPKATSDISDELAKAALKEIRRKKRERKYIEWFDRKVLEWNRIYTIRELPDFTYSNSEAIKHLKAPGPITESLKPTYIKLSGQMNLAYAAGILNGSIGWWKDEATLALAQRICSHHVDSTSKTEVKTNPSGSGTNRLAHHKEAGNKYVALKKEVKALRDAGKLDVDTASAVKNNKAHLITLQEEKGDFKAIYGMKRNNKAGDITKSLAKAAAVSLIASMRRADALQYGDSAYEWADLITSKTVGGFPIPVYYFIFAIVALLILILMGIKSAICGRAQGPRSSSLLPSRILPHKPTVFIKDD